MSKKIILIGFIMVFTLGLCSTIFSLASHLTGKFLSDNTDTVIQEKSKGNDSLLKFHSYNLKVTKVKNYISNISNDNFSKYFYLEIFSTVKKLLNNEVINDVSALSDVVRLSSGQITYVCPKSEKINDYASDMIKLNNYLKQKQIELLYIQAPFKVSNNYPGLPKGVDDFSNENADEYLVQIKQGGVNFFDLRNEITADGIENKHLFFKTDHHWTQEAGFWAFGKVGEQLTKQFGFSINKDFYSINNYNIEKRRNFFLGSQGKRTGRVYSGVDDISLITPKFQTKLSLSIPSKDIEKEGNFENVMLDKKHIEKKDYYGDSPYSVYMGGNYSFISIKNYNIDESKKKKVLLVKDSFAGSFAPFLSLACSELDIIDLRYYTKGLISGIEETQPDIVIFLYNPSMYSDKDNDKMLKFFK